MHKTLGISGNLSFAIHKIVRIHHLELHDAHSLASIILAVSGISSWDLAQGPRSAAMWKEFRESYFGATNGKSVPGHP